MTLEKGFKIDIITNVKDFTGSSHGKIRNSGGKFIQDQLSIWEIYVVINRGNRSKTGKIVT